MIFLDTNGNNWTASVNYINSTHYVTMVPIDVIDFEDDIKYILGEKQNVLDQFGEIVTGIDPDSITISRQSSIDMVEFKFNLYDMRG